MPRPCAHRAVTGHGHGPVLPPRTSTPPTLSASQAQRALAPPGSLSHIGSLAPACGALSSLPPCSPVPAPGYLLRDPGQRDRDRGGRAAAPHSADFAIRGGGLWRGTMSVGVGWSLDLHCQALSSRASPGRVADPTPAAAPRRKTMRPPGALGRAPAAPPASQRDPPPARLGVAATNPALVGRLDPAFLTPLRQ